MGDALPVVPSISIHALREEGDAPGKIFLRHRPYFYPRPPRGGRPAGAMQMTAVNEFLSTPSARRATVIFRGGSPLILFLSTPSARRATAETRLMTLRLTVFLSTPSARRATQPRLFLSTFFPISIHALREEGDRRIADCAPFAEFISIHALREEGDPALLCTVARP